MERVRIQTACDDSDRGGGPDHATLSHMLFSKILYAPSRRERSDSIGERIKQAVFRTRRAQNLITRPVLLTPNANNLTRVGHA